MVYFKVRFDHLKEVELLEGDDPIRGAEVEVARTGRRGFARNLGCSYLHSDATWLETIYSASYSQYQYSSHIKKLLISNPRTRTKKAHNKDKPITISPTMSHKTSIDQHSKAINDTPSHNLNK